MSKDPIAIIGIGCRFPGGINHPDALWKLLVEGREAVGEVPPDRWNVDRYYDGEPGIVGKSIARRGGFVDGIDLFFIARVDLSKSLGFRGDKRHPEVRAVVDRLIERIHAAGRHVGVAGDYLDATGKVYTVHRPPGPELNLAIKDVGRLLPMTRHTFRIHKDGGAGGDWVRFIVEDGRRVMLWETGRLVRRE